METTELYLKTVFACIACDGNIAPEEVALVHELASKVSAFGNLDVEAKVNDWIGDINKDGTAFLKNYLSELRTADLSAEEQLGIIDLAFKAIEADNRIEYAEVKFFKKIRRCLPIDDSIILEHYPDKEDFLLPDISTSDDFAWDSNIKFESISIN